MARTTTLTDNEFTMLTEVVYSQYHDGRDPVGDHVWFENPFPTARTASGVMASLVKKGFVEVYNAGDADERTAAITAAGMAAYTAKENEMNAKNTKTTKTTKTTAAKATKSKAATSKKSGKAVAPKAPRGGGRPVLHTREQVITLLSKENPKREGTKAFKKWELYKNGMTVGEYLDKGGKRSTLRWDVLHGLISIA